MATEEDKPTVKSTEESLEGKLGDLNLEEKVPPASEETEKFEDSKDTPVDETPEEVHETVLEELKEGPPKLHHVETKDTTDPAPGDSTTDGVLKSEVPEAFQEELKSDHDIVSEGTPAESKDTPTSVVETVKKETGADSGETTPPTRETPVEVTHEDVDSKAPPKSGGLGGKISETFHKIVGSKDASS